MMRYKAGGQKIGSMYEHLANYLLGYIKEPAGENNERDVDVPDLETNHILQGRLGVSRCLL